MDITCSYRDVAATQPSDFPCWLKSKDQQEITAHYLVAIDVIRAKAKELGYAIGVHGSLRRDLDLIAAPWIEEVASPMELVREIHKALNDICFDQYELTKANKPHTRLGTVFAFGRHCFLDISIMAASLSQKDSA